MSLDIWVTTMLASGIRVEVGRGLQVPIDEFYACQASWTFTISVTREC